jgi:hypothetical protein
MMIEIYNPNGDTLRTIPNDDFFKQISAMELLVCHPEYDEQTSNWHFIIFSGAIRFCTGNPEKLVWIPITSDIDVDRFKKYWYLAYVEAHGYDYAVTHANGEIQLKKAQAPNNKGGSQ